MGHKAGSRHTGGQGTMKARRLERAAALVEMEDVGVALEMKAVKDAAAEHSIDAVTVLAGIMHNGRGDMVRIMAARELLKLSNSYPGTGKGIGAGKGGMPMLRVQVVSLTRPEQPVTFDVVPLAPQDQLTEPLDPTEAEVS